MESPSAFKRAVVVIFGCLSLVFGCNSKGKAPADPVDKFAAGVSALASSFVADTLATFRLERAHFTAQVQQALMSPERPLLILGNLSDMEFTNAGWLLRVERPDFWEPRITYLLECDSSLGAKIFASVKPSLDSITYFYEGPRLAVIASIRSVSKALYYVDADVYGSGENTDYSLYVSGGTQMIARGVCLGFFVEEFPQSN